MDETGEPGIWEAELWIKEGRRPIPVASAHANQWPNLIETGWRRAMVREVPSNHIIEPL